jgi:predicted ribosome quality control (RQC) complex YloA/Tae2 family protein
MLRTGLSTTRALMTSLHLPGFFRTFAGHVVRMITDYYTLYHLAADLRRRIRGLQLAEAFTQSRHEAVFGFATPDDRAHDASARLWLLVSCEPSRNYLYVRSSFARAKRNTFNIFPSVISETIADVAINESDREVILTLHSDRRIVLQMFRSTANVLLLERDGSLAETFLKRHPAPHAAASARRAIVDPASVSDFAARFRSISAKDARSGLKGLYPRLSSPLLEEAFARAGLTPHDPPATLSDMELGRLFQAVSGERDGHIFPDSPQQIEQRTDGGI